MNRQKMIRSPFGVIENEVAVTNGNDVPFAWDADFRGNDLPYGFKITAIDVIPHDGADPGSVVATIWRLRIYKRAARSVKDIKYEYTNYGGLASNVPSFDNTPWQWENMEKKGVLHGTIGIESGANDASFTISVSFERW